MPKWPAMIDAQYTKSLQTLFFNQIALIFYAIGTDIDAGTTDDRFDFLRARGRSIADRLPNVRSRPEGGSIRDRLAWAREAVRSLVAVEAPSIISRTAARLNRYVRLEVSRFLGRSVTGTPREIDIQISNWIETNTQLIRSVDFTEKISDLIETEFKKGSSLAVMKEALAKKANLSKSKANIIAVDQTGKLYSQLTEYRHREQGILRARWITKRDSRVRDSHRKMHGVIFSWDDLPIVDGEKTAPGRPIMCRCVAEPVVGPSRR